MYGLLLENLAEYVKVNYGEDKWDEIRRQCGIDAPSFSVHQVYPENLLNKLAKKAQQVSNAYTIWYMYLCVSCMVCSSVVDTLCGITQHIHFPCIINFILFQLFQLL